LASVDEIAQNNIRTGPSSQHLSVPSSSRRLFLWRAMLSWILLLRS
jgi:hypothetical protein